MTRGERVIAFIERYIKVPEGKHVRKPLVLMEFQKRFILDVYDNPSGTRRAYLSIGRKNGKSALIAAIALAHIVGPEAKQNTQIVSGALSQKQAALVFKLMQKMIGLDETLRAKSVTRIVPSQKQIVGVKMNVEYQALSAEAGTAHGLSPILAILDEAGQIKGPEDDFVEAIETSQGAHDAPMLMVISTQAPTDNDLFSRWLDDAETSKDPQIVSHVYSAPADCDLMDREAWKAANPALGEFRSLEDVEALAAIADRQPSKEPSFRWLFLNQRVEATAPFVSKNVWQSCASAVAPLEDGAVLFGGLDLSEVSDLTALVLATPVSRGPVEWDVHPTFWLPSVGLREKAKADRVPYDVWHNEGALATTPGPSVDYEFVAAFLWGLHQRYDVRKIAFDRYNWRFLKPWLAKSGFSEDQLEGDAAIFEPFGQGFASMSPALRDLEGHLLNQRIAHGDHPVLEMCARNAVVTTDPAGNRKLVKKKSHGRIDGMVALAMAMSVAGTWQETNNGPSVYETRGLLMI
jgi:phage terminase large subunit-like protein